MKIKIVLIPILFFSIVIFPSVSNAYEVVSASSYKLTSDTYLFTIKYEFGFLNAKTWLPIQAQNNFTKSASVPELSYQLIDSNKEEIKGGQTVGIILSDAEVRGDFYRLDKTKREDFTLLVIHRADDASSHIAPAALVVNELAIRTESSFGHSYTQVDKKQLEKFRSELTR